MADKCKKKINGVNGSATIEMIIIFPVIMFIIFIFMYATLFLYQTAHAQSVANKTAQHASNSWNLVKRDMIIGKVYPADFKGKDPYSKILPMGNDERIDKVEKYARRLMVQYNVLSKDAKNSSYKQSDIIAEAKLHNYIITKKLEITIKQPTKMPISGILELFGVKGDLFYAKGYAEATINDPAEFVKNTDFVVDLIEETEKGQDVIQKVSDYKDKLYRFCEKLGFDFNGTGGASGNGTELAQNENGQVNNNALALTGEDQKLTEAVKKIQPIEGYKDLVIHSDGDKFKVLRNGKWESLSHRDVAKIVKNNNNNKKEPIRLIACESGGGGKRLAQDLSNKLGVEILAPSNTVWIQDDGSLTVGKDASTDDGQWNKFTPGKNPNEQ